MLDAQLEILKVVAAGCPLPEVLDLIARAKEQLLPDERCAISLIDTDRVTVLNGASPSLPPQLSAALHHVQLAGETGSRDPVDPREHPAWRPYRDVVEGHGLAVGRAEPIVSARGEVAGYAMSLVVGEARLLSDEEAHWMKVYAELTLVALRHAQVDESLQMSEGRLAAVIENSPAVIAMSDPAGRYVLANRAVQELLGVPPQDLLGSDVRAAFGDEVAEVVTALRRQVMETLIPLQEEVEVAGRCLQVVYFPVRTPRGTPYAVGEIAIDVTENKRSEERVAQASKMQVASQLASEVAHDFNNILAGIAISASAADEPDAGLDDLRTSLGDVKTLALRAADLTQRLLTFASPGPAVLEELDLADVVDAVGPLLKAAAQGKGSLRLDLPEVLPRVVVDRSAIERALVNLVVNARDAVGDDGHIVVTCGVADTDPSELVLSVTDDGHGMDTATVARVFEPFFTTKQGRGTGFGLGLAVVQGVAYDAGGRVQIESEVGRGTAVHLYVPVAGGAAGSD